jgi:hypothetical protein
MVSADSMAAGGDLTNPSAGARERKKIFLNKTIDIGSVQGKL